MIRSLLFIYVLSIITLIGNAQNTQPVIAKALYSFTHIIDTTQPDKPHTESMVLLLGKKASVYLSLDEIKQLEALQRAFGHQIPELGGLNQIFYFPDENQLLTERMLGSSYLVQEPAYKISWTITNDTMSIEGVSCLKATARFRGRNWIAWFAPDMPFNAGPWKLHGLPGLIVSAHDDKNEVIFSFAGFENVTKATTDQPKKELKTPDGKSMPAVYNLSVIQLPEKAIRASKKEFARLEEAMKKDPHGFFQTQMAGSGSNIKTVVGKPVGASTGTKPPEFNNPIELSEN